MKIFVAIISLLIGIMLGAAITAFLVVKKNPMIRETLCKDFTSKNSIKANPLSGLIDSSFLKDTVNDINKNLQEKNSGTENPQNSAAPSENPQQELLSEGPGGCKTEDECLLYCSNLENLKECLDFAKKHINSKNQKQE